jgi:peptidoglycan/LPS O-acetylase OafA/YrhL
LSGTTGRLHGIDGVRALAAGSILVYHCWLWGGAGQRAIPLGAVGDQLMPHLSLGVTLFFTLSGFLLYRPFVAALLRAQARPSLHSYLRNRALRILPAYWVILLLVSLALGAAVRPNTAAQLEIGSLADQPVYLVRAMAFMQSYSPLTLFLGIGPAWSLSVEVVFYLALPALVIGTWALVDSTADRRRRQIVALVPPLALLVVGLSGKIVAAFYAPGTPSAGAGISWRDVVTYSAWGQADLFAPGMLLAIAHVELEDRASHLRRWARHAVAALAVLLAVAAIALSGGDGLGPYAYRTLMAVVGALFLAVVVLAPPDERARSRLHVLLDSRVMTGLGLVSYSLFLWHEPLIHLATARGLAFGGPSGLVAAILLVGGAAVAASILTYLLVEKPALARKRSLRAPAPVAEVPLDRPMPAETR